MEVVVKLRVYFPDPAGVSVHWECHKALETPPRFTEFLTPSQFGGTLLTDGYEVYTRYMETVNGLTHALCWSHTRRKFEEGLESEPRLCGEALDRIGKLYEIEAVLQMFMRCSLAS